MKVISKFELTIEVDNKTLEHLMSNEETKKMTLDVFKDKLLDDLTKSMASELKSTIKVTEVTVEE